VQGKIEKIAGYRQTLSRPILKNGYVKGISAKEESKIKIFCFA